MAWIRTSDSPAEIIEVPEGTPGSTPGPPPGLIPEYKEWLASSLSHFEVLAKRLIKHRAEKGRVVESVVKSALRTILPGRFSIGTGFVITSSGQSSPQLDLVIYDGLFNAPILFEGGTGLFPVECVYGFVEVKSALCRQGIDDATRAIATVRNLAKEKRYVAYGTRNDGKGNKVTGAIELLDKLPPRSFIFAINSDYSDIETLVQNLREATQASGAHIHGLAAMDKAWFIKQRPYSNPSEFICREGRAFDAFCAAVLASVQSISMLPASMNRYLRLEE